MKKTAWPEGRTTAAIFIAVLLFNLSQRSLFYNFDGIACAIAVELSDFKHLVHGNHLAYGVVGWCFDKIWRVFGYQGQSVLVLQVLDSVLGAAGAAIFSSLLRRMGRGERESVLAAAALAVSHAWWFWSLEAQVYMLGALFAALAAREVLSEKPRPALVGLWHAGAILGHVGHLMALPALLFVLTRKRNPREAFPYLSSLSVAVAIPYICAGLFAVDPSSFNDLRLWLLGSAALTTDRSFHWHSIPLSSALPAWLGMSLRIFTEFVGRQGPSWFAGVALAVLPLLAAARGAADRTRESVFWLLWLAGYAVLFIAWEPYTIVYRVSDLLALWALATMGLKSLPARARQGALVAWTAAALAFNLTYVVRPAADPANNPDLVEAEWTKISAPEHAWVLANGRGAVYIPYFTARRPVNLRYYTDEKALHARLDALTGAGEAVYVSGRTLLEEGLRGKLERYGLHPSAAAGNLAMYRVQRFK
ncbi:MAG: hypothetical protein Q8T11_02270 [Elusimicrobiota bacterium]|nr:hypothetical protein [Elusimicrobiota bacterium]